MFRKLVSNLPYNPSLFGQLRFYSQRLKQENAIRRIGFAFVALAMFIQMFAVMSPPEKSLAYSNDYIINGLRTRDDILRAWDRPGSDVSAIYGRFGLTRADIAALPLNPNSTIVSDQADYWTIGRNSLSGYSKVASAYKSREIPVQAGPSTVYLRQLRAWDIVNPRNTYRAFQGSKNGKAFWILVDCGNFTQVGLPPLAKPKVELRKTIDGGPRNLKPGDTFSFRFEYRNPVVNSQPVEGAYIQDQLDLAHFDIVSPANLPLNGNLLNILIGAVPYSTTYRTAMVLTVRLKKAIPNNTAVCNAAHMISANAGDAWSGGAPNTCVTVLNPCPLDSKLSATDKNCTEPVLACSLTDAGVNLTTKEVTLKTVVSSTNAVLTKVSSYTYEYGDGTSKTVPSTALTDTSKHVFKDGTFRAQVTVQYKVGTTAGSSKSVLCAADVEITPDKPLGQSKEVANLTQNLTGEKAATSKAKSSDVLEYKLITHNSFNYARANVTVSDNIADILEYADLDRSFLSAQGGTYDEATKSVVFANQTVQPNSSVTKLFRVKLKAAIPSTNQPSAMTTSYDCAISNKYGNELSIPVDCPPEKTAEYISKSLPNTGPGTSLLIGFVGTTIIAYFFARTRLLAQEVEIIRSDYAAGGM